MLQTKYRFNSLFESKTQKSEISTPPGPFNVIWDDNFSIDGKSRNNYCVNGFSMEELEILFPRIQDDQASTPPHKIEVKKKQGVNRTEIKQTLRTSTHANNISMQPLNSILIRGQF